MTDAYFMYSAHFYGRGQASMWPALWRNCLQLDPPTDKESTSVFGGIAIARQERECNYQRLPYSNDSSCLPTDDAKSGHTFFICRLIVLVSGSRTRVQAMCSRVPFHDNGQCTHTHTMR